LQISSLQLYACSAKQINQQESKGQTYDDEAIFLLQGEHPTLHAIQLRVVASELSGATFALAFLFETIERGGRVQSCLFFLEIETGGRALGYCEIHFGLIGG
jgi:hypothetical protein